MLVRLHDAAPPTKSTECFHADNSLGPPGGMPQASQPGMVPGGMPPGPMVEGSPSGTGAFGWIMFTRKTLSVCSMLAVCILEVAVGIQCVSRLEGPFFQSLKYLPETTEMPN